VLRITFGCKVKVTGNLKYYQYDRRKTLRSILGEKVVRKRVDETDSALCIMTDFVSDILPSEVK
jgi:hypothetical protein